LKLYSSPLWALIAFAIIIEDGLPIFYGQERVGKNGRIFRTMKFRSMIKDAERETGPVQAVENDPRITNVGKILRATAMDELPQLVNILKGDMSFVGPRSLRPKEKEVHGNPEDTNMGMFPGITKDCLCGLA
jgi:lipopolysaccharide/colanic/teichoic acid biosynthesis glycosyltransferase